MNQSRLNSSIHCLCFMMGELCLDRWKCLLYGIQVQWIWREVDKLHSCMGGVILMVTTGHGQGIYLPHSCSTIHLTSSLWWIAQLSKMMALRGPGQGVSLGAYINQNPKSSSERQGDWQDHSQFALREMQGIILLWLILQRCPMWWFHQHSRQGVLRIFVPEQKSFAAHMHNHKLHTHFTADLYDHQCLIHQARWMCP